MARAMMGMRYSLKALGGRFGEQWERERRDTLFLMGGTLLAALPHFAFMPWWASVGFLMLFVWRLGLVLSGRWLPRDSVRWVAALACTAAVYAHYQTLFGREAGVTILLLFLGLKLLEMRARRDLFVVLFLCFFLLLTAFFETQSMLMAASSIVAVVMLVATMITMQFGEHEVSIGARMKMTGWLLLQALPLAAVLFVLFPRLQNPLWAMPDDKIVARMGLSDTMQPGSIAELKRSDEVAMRVLFHGPAPRESEMYWRGPVMTEFDGRSWRTEGSGPPSLPLPRPRLGAMTDLAPGPGPGRTVRYTVTLEPNNQSWLIALEAPASIELGPQRIQPDPLMQMRLTHPIDSRTRYDVESRLDYRLGLHESEADLASQLRLPPGLNPRTSALAAQWMQEEPDPRARIARVMKLFSQAPFRYTMKPPTLGTNGVDDFLFDTRAGFCEHYASAMAVLLRAMQIPARVVIGYQGGHANPVDGYWIVRQGDAHAWVEAWLAGRGWVRFDPVTAIAPERVDLDTRSEWSPQDEAEAGQWLQWRHHLTLNMDAITNAWNQWILSYDEANQKRLLDRFGLHSLFEDAWQLAGLLAAVLTVVIGAVALFTLHPRVPRDPTDRWYGEYCDRLAAVGLARARHETAGQHLERISPGLDAEQVLSARRIVALYNRLRYGHEPTDGDDNRQLRQLVKAFRP